MLLRFKRDPVNSCAYTTATVCAVLLFMVLLGSFPFALGYFWHFECVFSQSSPYLQQEAFVTTLEMCEGRKLYVTRGPQRRSGRFCFF